MNKMFEFLQEDNGGISYARVNAFIMTIAFIIDWMHSAFALGSYKPDIALTSIVIAAWTNKTIQKFVEQKDERKPT